MIRDTERFRKEDEMQYNRIQAKNSLESYCFDMKTKINNRQLRDKIDANNKKKIINTIEYALKWIEYNQGGMPGKFVDILYSDANSATDPLIEEAD
ncbi:unnamed protein product [Rotaria sp. Silwood1]|nr:unnamed protein product [Rotaria sp. Silwood1]